MRPPVTLALVGLLVVSVVLPVVVSAGHHSTPTNATTYGENAAAGETDEAAAPGERLSATVAAHEARVSGSFQASMVEVDLAAADSDRQRARRLAALDDELEENLNDVVDEWQRTIARYRTGEMDDATFRSRTAWLAGRASALSSLSETARIESVTVPPDVRNETGIDERNFAAIATHSMLVSANVSGAIDGQEARWHRPGEEYLFGDRDVPGFDTDFDGSEFHDDRDPDDHDGKTGNWSVDESEYAYDYNVSHEDYEAWNENHDFWDEDYEFDESEFDESTVHFGWSEDDGVGDTDRDSHDEARDGAGSTPG